MKYLKIASKVLTVIMYLALVFLLWATWTLRLDERLPREGVSVVGIAFGVLLGTVIQQLTYFIIEVFKQKIAKRKVVKNEISG